MAISKELLDADLLRLVTAGSVDDGKSTLIGRLLYDTKQILTDQLEHIEDASRRRGHDYVDLALLTDGLRAEREQGITIDVAYRSFVTPRRRFQLADAPGHVQYTRNMVTGASTADLAVILVDARKGVVEQTRRHGYITSILETPHVVFAVNKMDLVGFAEETFRSIESDLHELGSRLGLHDPTAIPISALNGDNVVDATDSMPWYDGPTLLQHLEAVPNATDRNLHDRRFPVQWVIRPGHDYRGYAGQVAGGVWRAGDEVVVLPSGLRSRVAAVETADGPLAAAVSPMSVTIRLEDDLDVSRGDLLADPDRPPVVARQLLARVCWMSEQPLDPRAKLLVKLTTRHVRAIVDELVSKVDIETLEDTRVSRAAGVERPRGRVASPGRAARRRRLRGEPLDGRVHPRRRGDERHRRGRHGARGVVSARAADPYRDTDVIDSRAPRFNQAVVGVVSVLAVLTGWWWLLALLAAQLAVGLTFGRRFCLPCLAYFELVQPRFGEGPLEDSRPPRVANMVGIAVLGAASIAYAAGWDGWGAGLGLLVAALALIAAGTGFCTGCEAYKLGCRLSGKPFVSCPIPSRPAA